MHTTSGLDIQIVREDITHVQVDAIVNAANSTLLGGGGVDGAIHRVGGPEVTEACQALRNGSLPQGLPVGQAIATPAGQLPARWVIHTVGPVYSAVEDRRPLLVSCYRSCLEVADSLGAKSIAFPTISAGAYGWPLRDATEVAVETLTSATTSVRVALLVAFSHKAEGAYRAALRPFEGS